MHARHAGNPLALVSGVTSGGASLVVLPSIQKAADLAGKRVATRRIGSTRSVSLRKWLGNNGLLTKERGGDVVVVDALASADILAQMRRGAIVGAWLPEPWATRIAIELNATRLVDERRSSRPTVGFPPRSWWCEGRSTRPVARRPTPWFAPFTTRSLEAKTDPTIRVSAFAEIKRLTGKGLPKPVMDASWERLDFTTDPIPDRARANGGRRVRAWVRFRAPTCAGWSERSRV